MCVAVTPLIIRNHNYASRSEMLRQGGSTRGTGTTSYTSPSHHTWFGRNIHSSQCTYSGHKYATKDGIFAVASHLCHNMVHLRSSFVAWEQERHATQTEHRPCIHETNARQYAEPQPVRLAESSPWRELMPDGSQPAKVLVGSDDRQVL